MNITILDAYSLEGTDLKPITSLGNATVYIETADDQVVERCADADVIVSNKVKIMRNHMQQLPKLKLICVAATGMNNVDLDAAKELSITVKNVPSYSTNSVAEATFAMALALKRNVVFYDSYVKSGQYANSGRCFNLSHQITQISGAKWGIIGLGAIGTKVAQIASAFGAQVGYYSISGKNRTDQFFRYNTLNELLISCDIVSIHTPLSDLTKDLIGEIELTQMKESAILINVARGSIVNEEALAQAIISNHIAGAGIDVFECEPVKTDNPLANIQKRGGDPNKLILAPHSAWSSKEACSVLVQKIANNITENI